MSKAKEVLATLKAQKEVEYTLFVKSDKGYLVNDETGNFIKIFKYSFGYGVYGNCVKDGQVDSRFNSDDEIANEIEKLMSLGELKTESEWKADFKNKETYRVCGVMHDLFQLG